MSEVLISAPGAGGAGDGGTLATRGGSVRGGATTTSRGAVVGGATRATMGAVVGVARDGTGVVVGVGRGGDGRAGRVVVGRGKVVGERTGRVVVGRAGTVVGGGSGAGGGGGGGSVVGGGGGSVVDGGGGSVVGGGGGSVVGGGGGGGKVVGVGGVWTVVGLAAASTVGRTSISHSRAVADPRLPSASARARTLPRCEGARRRVSPSPAGTPSTVQDVCTVSPLAAGRARRAVEPQRHAVRAHVRSGRDEVPRERHPWNRLAVQPPGAARVSADRRRSEALALADTEPHFAGPRARAGQPRCVGLRWRRQAGSGHEGREQQRRQIHAEGRRAQLAPAPLRDGAAWQSACRGRAGGNLVRAAEMSSIVARRVRGASRHRSHRPGGHRAIPGTGGDVR